MILVDTSVWADHFRSRDTLLVSLIAGRQVLMHRLVIEELAMGHLPRRARTLEMLARLPELEMLDTPVLVSFVEKERLVGTGIGPADTHLLASSVTDGALLWTRDKRLAAQAVRLGCAWSAD